MIEHFYAVIMAGGGGTRLWPLSRADRPKQMLNLLGHQTLFQAAVRRLEGLFPPEKIFVVTIEEQTRQLQDQCPEIPNDNFILEPLPMGTAGVVGLAAIMIKRLDEKAVLATLTADHFIGNEPYFRHSLTAAHDIAQQGYLVTFGIKPTFAATGYGYIQLGPNLNVELDLDVFHVKTFKEKPDQVTAQRMIDSGGYAWNSGMFIWQVDQILWEIDRQMPGLAQALSEIERDLGTSKEKTTLNQIWPTLVPQTVDYGIMEAADKVAVIYLENLGWDDVGSWESIFDVAPADSDGNIILSGLSHLIDTTNTLIYDEQADGLIVTIGVNDLVIVKMGDALLVSRKDQSQRVRDVVRHLKNTKKDRYL